MALTPSEYQSDIIDVTFANTSAVNVSSNSRARVNLYTNTTLTGYILLGVIKVQTVASETLGIRDFTIKSSDNSANLVATNFTNASITIPIGEAQIIARYMKI